MTDQQKTVVTQGTLWRDLPEGQSVLYLSFGGVVGDPEDQRDREREALVLSAVFRGLLEGLEKNTPEGIVSIEWDKHLTQGPDQGFSLKFMVNKELVAGK